jgi:hypothetical protein
MRFPEQAGKATALTPEQAKALAPLCDRRFPIARGSAPARLPADPFRRDMLCFGTLSVLQGAAEEIAKTGSDSGLTKIKAALFAADRQDDRCGTQEARIRPPTTHS